MKVKMEQRGRKLDSFKELVKKAVNAKAKAALWPRSYACKTDQHCLQGSQSSAVKTSTQGQLIKDPMVKKPKSRLWELKAAAPLHSTNNVETSKQAQKKKKKKEKQERHNQKRGTQNSTSTIGANNTSTGKEKSKKTAPTVKTQARLPVKTVAKRDTTLTSAPSHPNQKTNVSLGNLRVGNYC